MSEGDISWSVSESNRRLSVPRRVLMASSFSVPLVGSPAMKPGDFLTELTAQVDRRWV